jgi:hypothetical protein
MMGNRKRPDLLRAIVSSNAPPTCDLTTACPEYSNDLVMMRGREAPINHLDFSFVALVSVG